MLNTLFFNFRCCVYMHVQMVVWYILIESTLIYIVHNFILLFSQNDFFSFWLIHSVFKNYIRLSIFRGSSGFIKENKKIKLRFHHCEFELRKISRVLTLSVIGLFYLRCLFQVYLNLFYFLTTIY